MQNYANLTRTRRSTRHFTRPLNNAINEFQMTFIGFQYTIELSEGKISPHMFYYIESLYNKNSHLFSSYVDMFVYLFN